MWKPKLVSAILAASPLFMIIKGTETEFKPFGLPEHALHPASASTFEELSYLPVSNSTKSFWTHGEPDANPLATEGSTGTLTADADVCVIGSGITGVSAAYHVAQGLERDSAGDSEKAKVLVLEAREFCTLAGTQRVRFTLTL
jgi:hypothetical protein